MLHGQGTPCWHTFLYACMERCFPCCTPPAASSYSPVTTSYNSSSASATLSSTTSSASASTSGVSTTGVITILLSSYSFAPYPTPTLNPLPPVFPATDPLNPLSVSSDPQVMPDFAPAWATAYQKAKTLDSPLTVHFADYTTVFPAGIQSWNCALMRACGLALGQEFKGKGANIALRPMMNMGCIAQGGRNWEGFGADPFLTSESAYKMILGLQNAGVQATAKHFINNEQEHFCTSESSNVNDWTQHEIYAHLFLRSVMAGVLSIMCSYNLINETYACNNDKMLNDILKWEYSFQDFIQSDWLAMMLTLSAVAGLDMTMPGDIIFDSGNSYFGSNLMDYVNDGYISMARLDDMATCIIAAWYFLHQDKGYPAMNFSAFNPNNEVTNQHPRNLVLIGSDAGPGNSSLNEFTDQGGSDGILAMGWGSGTGNFPYLILPLEGIQERACQDGSSVFWDFDDWNTALAGNMAYGEAVALVFTNSDSGEDYITVDGNQEDHNNLTAGHNDDDLILAVAVQNM
ncbi:glycoside hydrolase superfamily [Suillus subluteus]|nr:glycoside hydrolase superfamily [Suillus subluteus]